MKKKTAPATAKKTAVKSKTVKKTAVKKAAVKKTAPKARPVVKAEPVLQQRELIFALSLIVAAMAIFIFF